jgi:HD-GYP domain-containing protein (c-di-GMP phosphodiesterase class II)
MAGQANGPPDPESVVTPTRAETLAALSLAIDLGLGQPMEHMLRACVLAMRLADELQLNEDRRATVYYATLLAWIGCHADSYELAVVFGDDIAFRASVYSVDNRGMPLAALMLRQVGAGQPPLRRAGKAAGFLVGGARTMQEVIRSHCTSAGMLAAQMGLGERLAPTLACLFERWDGAGLPNGVAGAEIPLEIRIVQLADTAEVFLRAGGADAAVAMVRRRRGTHFDPDLADLFCARAADFAAELAEVDPWPAALRLSPEDARLTPVELDEMLLAMGDFADLKSPFTAGHSRGVSALAEEAGRQLNLPPSEVTDLRRAGLAHDLGRLGVSNQVWEKASPLSDAERERVELHPYLTERILRRVPSLVRVASLAAAHHERLDGSGYPRGATSAALSPADRVLAAADAYQGYGKRRPHRPALPKPQAVDRLQNEVRAGRLDADAVQAVLVAAGQRRGKRTAFAAGLTEREVGVLRLLTGGLSNRLIAQNLSITEKTARNHVEHIYAKIGASNRTGATLFAIRNGLVGWQRDAN